MEKIRLYIYACVLTIATCWGLSAQGSQFTVVIDAGHGGRDAGAVGYGYKEKNIVLSVAKKLGRLIKSNHSNVRVLYTRERDVFVGLQERADFANRNKASLFISIHANSAGKSSSVYGTETYVMGLSKLNSNLSVAMRENKSMLLEDNYATTYKGFDPTNTESYIMFDMMQEAYLNRSIDMATFVEKQYRRNGRSSRGVRQDAFWVLSQSAMPSILTEIGFISNKNEAEYMASESGQDEIAGALSRAFSKFYESRDTEGRERSRERGDTTARAEEDGGKASTSKKSDKATASSKSKTGKERYRVQIMSDREKIDTSDKRFARLKHKVRREKVGSLWIYTVGNSKTIAEAKEIQKSIKKFYRDSFIIEYQGTTRGNRVS